MNDKDYKKIVNELFLIFDEIAITKGKMVDEIDEKRFDSFKEYKDKLYQEALEYIEDVIIKETIKQIVALKKRLINKFR